MESLFDWLAGACGEDAGRTTGDETLVEAFFDGLAGALLGAQLRPAVVAGGCQADPGMPSAGALERLAEAAGAACRFACGPGCGAAHGLAGGAVELVVEPLLHQIDTGPLVVAADRRAQFGFTLATRRVDACPSPWRAATHELVWSLSPQVAAGALELLARRAAAGDASPLPRALDASASPSGRLRGRARAKPGTAAPARPAAAEAAAWRALELALAGRLLDALRGAAELEAALAALAAALSSAETVDEILHETATGVGQALDASRAVAIVDRTAPPDEAPTNQLVISALDGEVHQGVYSRVDTRRLSALDRGDAHAPVSRLVLPIARDEQIVGELRLVDARPSRVWTLAERKAASRAAALAAEVLTRPLGGRRGGAEVDAVTGFERGPGLERRLADMIVDAQATGRPVSLVRLDIEGLERVFDAHGHTAGDALLRHVAAVLESQIARDEESTVARLGGSGFAVLLPGFTNVAASRVAEVLLDAISSSDAPLLGEITPRAGAATFPDAAATAAQLITAARPSADERGERG